MLLEKRYLKLVVALSYNERETLQRICDSDGSSIADVVRRLIRQEARRLDLLPSVKDNEASTHYIELREGQEK